MMLWDFINCCYHQIFDGHVVTAVAPEDSFSLILRNLGQGLEKTGWNYRWTAHQIFILRYLWYMSSHWVNLLERENWKGINILGILPLSIACKLWSFGPTAVLRLPFWLLSIVIIIIKITIIAKPFYLKNGTNKVDQNLAIKVYTIDALNLKNVIHFFLEKSTNYVYQDKWC